jgi:hypothetical protein
LTFDQFIQELLSDFKSYEQDIDKLSIKRYVIGELKRFGNNILNVHEQVLIVKNSQVILPENFRALKLVAKVMPHAYSTDECNKEDLQKSIWFKTTIENEATFDQISLQYIESCCPPKIIKHIVPIGRSFLHTYYKKPVLLTLTKGIDRSLLTKDCLNLPDRYREISEHQISITNNLLRTNFSEGYIYIQYTGLDMEDGEIVIPEGWHGNLTRYLLSFCKAKIVENLIVNNKNPQSLSQMLPFFRQDALNDFKLAQTEWKFKAMGENIKQEIKKINRREFLQYNIRQL